MDHQKVKLKIKEDTKAIIRCIPFDENPDGKNCILSGEPASTKSYLPKHTKLE